MIKKLLVAVFLLLLGPICFAYDVNTIAHYVHFIHHVRIFTPVCLLAGIILSEIAIPIAVLVFIVTSLVVF